MTTQTNAFLPGKVFSIRLANGDRFNQFSFGQTTMQAAYNLSQILHTTIPGHAAINVSLGNVGHCNGFSIKLVA